MIIFYGDVRKTALRVQPGALDAQFKAYLARNEPRLMRLVARKMTDLASDVSYAQIRASLLMGDITEDWLDQMRKAYSKFIAETMKPFWQETMLEAAAEIKARFPEYFFDLYSPEIERWAHERSAELVTNITDGQRAAIREIVSGAAQSHVGYETVEAGALQVIPTQVGFSVDELACYVRPVVGLYAAQTAANFKYYTQVQANLLARARTAAGREKAKRAALNAAIRYAEKQHRYRAMMIARTELMAAYNIGKLDGIRQAQQQQLMGRTQKRLLTAGDARVCDYCRALDETQIDLEAEFQAMRDGRSYAHWLAPPLHPHCRCTLVFEEVEPPVPFVGGVVKSFRECLAKYNHHHDALGRFASADSALPRTAARGIIDGDADTEDGGESVSQVHTVGRIDLDIFRCVTPDISTDEVIITDERIEHIRQRHPLDYERYLDYIADGIESPDYILRDNDTSTAVILKAVLSQNQRFRLILKLKTSFDDDGRKNSVITFLSISEKKWNKYLRNKEILYTRE